MLYIYIVCVEKYTKLHVKSFIPQMGTTRAK